MVKSEEINRQHADDIQKIRAKERQQVFTIREQVEVISKQAETLSKQPDTLSKQADMISFLTRKDMWDLQAKMVKSEETNREHADDIEKIRAKERQQVFTIREQAEAISKQAETLSKQSDTLSKQAEMKSFLTRLDKCDLQARMVKSEETNRQHADDIEKIRAKERQQVFTIREQAEAISKQAETLSKQADTLSKQAEMISFLTKKVVVMEGEPVEGVVGLESAGQTSSNNHGGALNNGGGTCEPWSKHNHVIHIRGGVLAESSQSSGS
nr:hypothetical protein [Tanacetum cinerariifolium]